MLSMESLRASGSGRKIIESVMKQGKLTSLEELETLDEKHTHTHLMMFG